MLIKLVTIFLSSSRAARAVVAEINNFSSAHVPTMIDESFYIAMSLARCSFFHATLGSLNFAFPPQIAIIFPDPPTPGLVALIDFVRIVFVMNCRE